MRAEERLLDFREEDFRPPRLRLAEDFRRDDFLPAALRALLARFRVERFLAPPLLRPEDPDRDLFLPLFDLLDFLAAAMEGLRVGGFVATDSKIRAQQRQETPDDAAPDRVPTCVIISARAFHRVA